MFYLLIFESIGTQELILIGIVAMMFLGPRKLPEYAKKIGKMMAEFRGATQEFKNTWEREVNFDEEAKALRIDEIETKPVARTNTDPETIRKIESPTVKTIDKEKFDELRDQHVADTESPKTDDIAIENKNAETDSDKRNWL